MNLFAQLAKVRAARSEMALARLEMSVPAAALFERGKENPLTTVGAAAGAGFVLGTLNVHPLRVPGMSSLLGGGLAEIMSHGTQLISELGAFGLGSMKSDDKSRDDPDAATDSDSSPSP
jgi:hypothetical protein